MSWYKFSKDYVESIISQNNQTIQQADFSPGLENSLTEERTLNEKKNGYMPLDTWMALNSSPDAFKAQGAGGEYNLKEHQDINMPEGGDNFIDRTYSNS